MLKYYTDFCVDGKPSFIALAINFCVTRSIFVFDIILRNNLLSRVIKISPTIRTAKNNKMFQILSLKYVLTVSQIAWKSILFPCLFSIFFKYITRFYFCKTYFVSNADFVELGALFLQTFYTLLTNLLYKG